MHHDVTSAPTTLERTIVPGDAKGAGSERRYFGLRPGPGEPFVRRTDLGACAPRARRSLLHLVHLTDMQIVDVCSPARMEFIERLRPREALAPLLPAHRPQESLALQAFDALLRTVARLGGSGITGAPVQLALTTGDAIDNQQWNELQWFLDVMSGSEVPARGSDGFLGVQ